MTRVVGRGCRRDGRRRAKKRGERVKMKVRALRMPVIERKRRVSRVRVGWCARTGQGEGEESEAVPWK